MSFFLSCAIACFDFSRLHLNRSAHSSMFDLFISNSRWRMNREHWPDYQHDPKVHPHLPHPFFSIFDHFQRDFQCQTPYNFPKPNPSKPCKKLLFTIFHRLTKRFQMNEISFFHRISTKYIPRPRKNRISAKHAPTNNASSIQVMPPKVVTQPNREIECEIEEQVT